MTKKNILQVVEHLLPGGAERMAVNISNVLANEGFKVTLCPTRAVGALADEVQDNVKITCLYKSSFLDIKAFYKLYKIVKNDDINIIHAHSTSVIWASLIKIFKPKIKIIWHDHYGNRLTDKNNFIYKKLAFLINGIITVNDELKQWSILNMKIKNVENIIYLNNFPVLKKQNSIKVKTDIIKIVLLSNLRKEKDHLSFVKALVIVKNKIDIKDVKVLFAGLYWENDYFEEIQTVIKENDLSNSIEFLGSVNQVGELLNTCDIGVICSTFEGLPVSLLEYGLAGLAVIVTDVGQCANVVDNGKAGIVVSVSNPEELANALIEIILNNEKRKFLGNNLQNRILNEYGSVKFLKFYNKLLTNI